MANRAMQAKVERARRQAKEAAFINSFKADMVVTEDKPRRFHGAKTWAQAKPATIWKSDKCTVPYAVRGTARKVTALNAAWAEAGQFTLIKREG